MKKETEKIVIFHRWPSMTFKLFPRLNVGLSDLLIEENE